MGSDRAEVRSHVRTVLGFTSVCGDVFGGCRAGGPDVPFPAQVSGYLGAGSSRPSFRRESRGERRRAAWKRGPSGQSVVPPARPGRHPTMIIVVLHSNDP